jgi:hypothetical protein
VVLSRCAGNPAYPERLPEGFLTPTFFPICRLKREPEIQGIVRPSLQRMKTLSHLEPVARWMGKGGFRENLQNLNSKQNQRVPSVGASIRTGACLSVCLSSGVGRHKDRERGTMSRSSALQGGWFR